MGSEMCIRDRVGSFGFLGSLNSAGVSTVAFFNGTNINVSGITTSAGGFVAGLMESEVQDSPED